MPRDFKTILCPTDFSEESYRAIEYGLRFAKANDGTLILAHVIHVPSGDLFQPDGHVLTFDEAKQKASINEALCKGCGTCVASCPSGSIAQRLFEDNEVFSEIAGLLAS